MTQTSQGTGRLIFIPFVISVLVTLLRLTGELRHWSDTWFYRPSGGIVPTSTNWVIGITWLAIPFGVYFAFKLASQDVTSQLAWKTIVLGFIGLIVFYGGLFLISFLKFRFTLFLLSAWSVGAIAGLLQLFGWRKLFKTLLAYGLASRAVVALVMFLAMRGNWGTHYDYFDMGTEMKTNLLSEYFSLAFFPQLIFWVGFTIVAGSLAGGITLAIITYRNPQRLADSVS